MIKQILQLSDGARCIYVSEPRGFPQLFCIHGGMGLCSASLMSGLKDLSRYFDLVLMDQRGCGASDAASDGVYSLDAFSSDIEEAVSILSDGRAVGIFGHSLGGMIAIRAISRFPSLFSFAILANTAHNDTWRDASHAFVQNLNQSLLASVRTAYREMPSDATLRDLAIAYGPVYFPEIDALEAESRMREFNYRDDSSKYTIETVYPDMNLIGELRAIKIPALVLSGALDVVVPPVHQQHLVRELSGSCLVVIEKAGHFPFITQTQQFSHSVSNWWKTNQKGLI